VGLLPFYLADRSDLIFSLVTFRGPLPVGGGSIWYLAVGTPYESLAQRYDTAAVLGAALLLGAFVVFARRDLETGARDLYGLLALSGLCFPLLIKTTWPYYFLDPYIFMAIWWLGGAGAWRPWARWLGMLLPLYFVGGAVLAEYGVSPELDVGPRRLESIAMAALLAAYILALGMRLLFRRRVTGHMGEPVMVAAAAAPGMGT
jgi:hypothetical protein